MSQLSLSINCIRQNLISLKATYSDPGNIKSSYHYEISRRIKLTTESTWQAWTFTDPAGSNSNNDFIYPTTTLDDLTFHSNNNSNSCLYLSSLSSNTSYDIQVKVRIWNNNSQTYTESSPSNKFTLSTYPEKISITSITYSNSQLTISWNQPPGNNAQSITNRIRITDGKNNSRERQINQSFGDQTQSFSISYLASDAYSIKIFSLTSSILARDDLTKDPDAESFLSTTYIFNYMALWDWDSANSTSTHSASATAIETAAARNAMRDKTAFSNFKAVVWNDMLYKIKEVLDYKYIDWDSTYGSFISTLKNSGDILTANAMNSFYINWIHATYGSSSSVSFTPFQRGELVLGNYFLNAMTALNDYIDGHINI